MAVNIGGSFAHRGFNLIFQVKSIWDRENPNNATADAVNIAWATELRNAVAPFVACLFAVVCFYCTIRCVPANTTMPNVWLMLQFYLVCELDLLCLVGFFPGQAY